MLLVDGVATDTLPADDRGFAYGHGCFETLLLRDGRACNLQAHLARLQRGCRRLGIPLPDDHQACLGHDLAQVLAAHPDAVLRITITAGSGPRGYRATRPQWRRVCAAGPLPADLDSRRQGLVVRLCRHRLGDQPALAGIKHLNRLDQVLAANELADDEHEGLVLDAEQRPVCATAANLWLRRGGRLLTPELARAGVAGTLRAWLLDAAREPGTRQALARIGVDDITEAPVSLNQLRQADEVLLSSSLLGISPILELRGGPWPLAVADNSVAPGLQALLAEHHVI